nr:porin [Gammaproteobacteria bacterium]
NWSLNDKVTDIFASREKQKGYFIEPSYRFGNDNQFGLFTRYSYWDNNAGDDNSSDAVKQTDFGMNYWLSPTVVFKADYQNQSGASDDDGFNLGVGYSF